MDYHNAQQCATMFNSISGLRSTLIRVMTGRKVKPKQTKIKDFLLLGKWKQKKKKGWKEQLHFVEILNAAFGGEDKRKKES